MEHTIDYIAKRKAVKKNQLPVNQVLDIVLKELDEAKAFDILTIDLKGKADFADFMVVASGRSQKHASSVATRLQSILKDHLVTSVVEGEPASDWFLLDVGDVIVNLFAPDARGYYNLEKMWGITFDHPESEVLAPQEQE